MIELIQGIQLQPAHGLCSSLAETCTQDANTPVLCSVGYGCRTVRILIDTCGISQARRPFDIRTLAQNGSQPLPSISLPIHCALLGHLNTDATKLTLLTASFNKIQISPIRVPLFHEA
jgi:hypothetical protein